MNTAINIAAALATIMAAVAAFLGIRHHNRNARETLRNERLSLSVDLIRQLRRDFEGEEMISRRKNAARLLLSVYAGAQDDIPIERYRDMVEVGAFFERMGLLVELGALDEYLAWTEFGLAVTLYGAALSAVSRKGDRSLEFFSYWRHLRSLEQRFVRISFNEAERAQRSLYTSGPVRNKSAPRV